ncbi:ribosomal processing [Coprinopsis cinerea okayama7|uniref:Ribosomal processing n=1 Tax=Coprinopsis cinerea (strain Okayama-7 / 130 / ATCC MYA-4618 / FGSC 9003) TaxID=240176 RepID=A8NNG5_COPC7|nr:RNA-binding domain-containing protein [Coprinopsis cinerea okayama7\|eukprot:XP_001835130.1 RNA-binding domain-containing protein [Coprinopsis cinerea okayama7\
MSTKLGKRKDREEDQAPEGGHGSTLFVSNLPYTATSVDLQTLFSDIAPVRSAFVVTEQGTGVSKGVGYVSFALKEDAESCYTKISEEGLTLAGRPIRAQWADKKNRRKEPKEEGEKKESKPKPAQAKAFVKVPHDPMAIRAIIVSGLPSGIDSKTLWKKIRKCPGAEKLEWPQKKENGEEDPSTAQVIFAKPSNAQDAVTKLHAHVYKGSLLSVTLKKRLENLAKPILKKGAKPAENAPTAVAPSRASRLIVRNLPFDVTEQDLRALFLPHGPVYSIDIPKVEETVKGKEGEEDKVVQRNKGFAFVWMLSKKDAEKALEACNGKAVKAGMAEELVLDKQKKKKQRRLEKKMAAAAAAAAKKEGAEGEDGAKGEEDEEEDDDKMDVDEEKKKSAKERVIAVDWALSKEKWKEEVAKAEQVNVDAEMASASGSGSEDEDDDESGSGSSGSESEDDSDDEGLGVHGEDSGSESDSQPSDSDDEDSRDDDDVPVKPQLPPPESGTTLFIRNVPWEATEDDLRTLFRAFGPLRYARITMDPETGRSRGTGFACFWNKEDADKVIEQSDILKAETMGQAATPKKNPFSLPSILTPDPSSSLARTLVLHGRTLDVVRAVTRDVASRLKEEGEKLREKQDKRNMYLLREGVIFPNSPAAAHLPPAELERRNLSYNSRKALLKSNPSLYVSRTRLSIRQLPIFATERMLKRLAIHAIRAFNIEFKEGKREGLTPDELTERSEENLERILREGIAEQEGQEAKPVKAKVKAKGKGRDTGVKQAKIVRQAERVDPITGKGRSKGYGFLELHRHADALRVLRWSNNNPKVNSLFEEWWQEEMKDILKKEQAKKGEERDEDRIKRIKNEIEALEEGEKRREGRGRLIVEFSIENVQVVQRRAGGKQERPKGKEGEKEAEVSPIKKAHGASGKKGPSKQKDGRDRNAKTTSDNQEPPAKRQKKSKDDSESTASSPSKPKKPFNPVGSLIGRKRKARKLKKA